MGDERQPERATFAAGCFWDAEAAFRRIDGIVATAVGYMGGSVPDPSYDRVAEGTTGHAEVVDLFFDPDRVSYGCLLETFWSIHDPTRADGQGDYSGPQYRSAIFYHTGDQHAAALASRDTLQASGRYKNPVLTAIIPASRFWPAEECHQQFYEKCAGGYCTSRQMED